MKLLISPLVKHEVEGIKVARTVFDAEKQLTEDVTEIYLYPFLKLGDNTWCKDINWGGYVVARIKAKLPNLSPENLWIIMDADHHAEPFEPIRYLGRELGYCTQHNSEEIDSFIYSLLEGKVQQGFARLKMDSCFHNDDPFWIKRIKEIQSSRSLYER